MRYSLAMININDIKQTEPIIASSADMEDKMVEDFRLREKELRLRISEQNYLKIVHELKESQQNTALRKIYISRNFSLTCIWLIMVFLIIVCQGFGIAHFNLHDSVLITLLSTTTANIIGVLVIVITYLFKNNHK